jgi:hypothetical protein
MKRRSLAYRENLLKDAFYDALSDNTPDQILYALEEEIRHMEPGALEPEDLRDWRAYGAAIRQLADEINSYRRGEGGSGTFRRQRR